MDTVGYSTHDTSSRYFSMYLFVLLFAVLIAVPSWKVASDLIFDKPEIAAEIAERLKQGPVDILYFGDSTVHNIDPKDTIRLGIDRILANKGPYTLLPAHSLAFSPMVYGDLTAVCTRAQYQPKIMVVTVNLRSFSGAWLTNPMWQFRKFRAKTRLLYGGFSLPTFFNYIRYTFTNIEKRRQKEWESSPVVYGDLDLGIRSSLEKAASGAADESLKRLSPVYALDPVTIRFMYHYMNRITWDHRMFSYLDVMVTEARAKGITIVAYLTPMNYREGVARLGEKFGSRVDNNIRAVNEYFKEKPVHYVDLSRALPPQHFTSPSIEHLDQEGREYVADRLHETITKFYNTLRD